MNFINKIEIIATELNCSIVFQETQEIDITVSTVARNSKKSDEVKSWKYWTASLENQQVVTTAPKLSPQNKNI